MVFWSFSLILAVSFLGRQAQAVPRPRDDGGQARQHHQHPENPARIVMGDPTTTAAPVVSPSDPGLLRATSSASDILGPTGATSTITTSTIVASTSIASSTPAFSYFESKWVALPQYQADKPDPVSYQILVPPVSLNDTQPPFSPVLFVCQTSSDEPDHMTSSNTWAIAHVPSMCSSLCCFLAHLICSDPPNGAPINPNEQNEHISFLDIHLSNSVTVNSTARFFFCLANNTTYIDQFVCNSYGPIFTIEASQGNSRDLSPRQQLTAPDMPTFVLSITSFSPGISVDGATITATAPQATNPSISATVSLPPTDTITTTVQSTGTASAAPSSVTVHSNGLSTGAKVGIALGALLLVAALLLAALFFLRRKHRSRSPPPEQVMLTRDMHTDSFGRNALIMEKENGAHNNMANGASPVDETLPIQRQSVHSPTAYDSTPAAPYTGAASAVPRRKPTNASTVSRISGPASPRSIAVSTPPDEYEEYRDQPMPVYGDARHSPRVFSAGGRQGVEAPFLTEDGMSAEEVARLEEEERRIDAAIAEAERSGRR
jgi:hypothetical protein